MKYRILSPIYFDGVLFPADTIVDQSTSPINCESLVERSWAVEYTGDEPAIGSVDELRAKMVEPVVEPVMESQDGDGNDGITHDSHTSHDSHDSHDVPPLPEVVTEPSAEPLPEVVPPAPPEPPQPEPPAPRRRRR